VTLKLKPESVINSNLRVNKFNFCRLFSVSYLQTLCRKGELSTISFSTVNSVFTFDIVKLGTKVFDDGLRSTLQSSKFQKVFHNCRQASDILFHRFGVTLNNVYDTQAAHSVFLTWAYCGGYMPKYTVSISHMARAYFGIQVFNSHF
jgi:ribonuclease D